MTKQPDPSDRLESTMTLKNTYKKNLGFLSSWATPAGFSIIEILIVFTLILGMTTLFLRNFTSQADSAREDQARIAMSGLASSLQLYKIHNGRYPSTADGGLQALVTAPPSDNRKWRGPYTEESKLEDPWGLAFDFKSDGRAFTIISAGRDNKFGTSYDIYYPEDKTPAAPQPEE